MNKYDVIVAGAGPSGLMAAGQAALAGAKVLLLEKMNTPANKLRITGGGRCNITNSAPLNNFIKSFGENGRFLRPVFSRFFSAELLQFLGSSGTRFITEPDGKIFPEGNDSVEIINFLLNWINKLGVVLQTGFKVNRLLIENGRTTGISGGHSAGMPFYSEKVIITTGGASYPGTGSSGDGYMLAKSAGHTIKQIKPSLVPLETAGETALKLQGVSLTGSKASIIANGKRIASGSGEFLFTHYGISGPVILSLSKTVVSALLAGQKAYISIDLKPDMDEKSLDIFLLNEINTNGKSLFKTLLKNFLPKKLAHACAGFLNIDPDKPCNMINSSERKKLRMWLKDFRLEIKNYRPLAEAVVTSGGVDTKEVNPNTMESRLVKGLYFAGEVLDIDADTGGYNLQAAFSTGWLAGRSAASNSLH